MHAINGQIDGTCICMKLIDRYIDRSIPGR